MAIRPHSKYISVEEYFELERTRPDQCYEYIDGEIYLMSGGSPAHALIIANLIGEIRAQIRGGPCKTFSSDAKVKVSETRYVCPDVTVSCVEQDRQARTKMLESPRFVLEVLSPGRGDHRDQYGGYRRPHQRSLRANQATVGQKRQTFGDKGRR